MAQQGNSAAEQEKEQSQASDTNRQAVTPELNALKANNLNLGLQQNGQCIPTMEQPPSDFTTSNQN
jgi:Flp pilus assembly protein TadG